MKRVFDKGRKGITARSIGWLCLLFVGGSTFLFGVIDEGAPRTDADRAYALAQRFSCPVCDGQSVADSASVVARNIRVQIAQRVDQGRSDEAIIAELEAVFPGNDYTPAASGLASLIWIIPVVLSAVALSVLVRTFWRQESKLTPSSADEELVAQYLTTHETSATDSQEDD